MTKSRSRIYLALPAVALLALAAACSSSKSTPTASTSPPPAPTTSAAPPASGTTASTVSNGSATVSGAMKTVLVAQDGKTLYYFTPDTSGQPTCTGSCASIWPPLTVAAPTAGSGVTGTLAVVMGANGDQVTYNGHPLYEYSKDTAAGQANGEGFAGKWHVATADLAAMAPQPSTGGSTSSGGGYGNG